MSTKKQDAKELFEDANKLYDGQLYEEALQHYQKATEIDLTFYDAHFCVAKTHIRLQSFKKGVQIFKKHIHLIPEEDQATYSIGLAGILLEEGQHERAYELIKEHGDEVSGNQLPTFLKILLANGKINFVLLHLLNLPAKKAVEAYVQITNNPSIKEANRKEFKKEYAIPEYHEAVEKATMLSNAPVQNKHYSQKADGVLRYLQQGKKDFGKSLQLYIDTLDDKITEVRQLLADHVQNNIEQQNTSRAQSQLVVLEKTDYDPVKIQELRSSLAAIKKQQRTTYLKYAVVALLAVLMISGAVFGYGYLNQRWAWSKARDADTYEAYRDYIADYPDGWYVDEALNAAEITLWEGIKKDSTQERYNEYLRIFPNGQFSHDARNILNTNFRNASQNSQPSNIQRSSNQNTTNRSARVTGSDVIIRSDHTTKSKVAGVVKNEGSKVRILNEYYPSNSNEAILKKDILVYANNHSIELHKGKAVSIVSTGGSRVRVKFATEEDGRVTATINKSDLESISSKKWYKVQTQDNTTGWIYGKFIDEL